MVPPSGDETPARGDLVAVSLLADPTRRRLYDHVVAARAPVTRDDVSAVSGFERSVVGYHLDKLVAAGLLTATYARPEGRTGPGAGRPAKWYERADSDLCVTLPPRAYQLAADLLARTLDAADASDALCQQLEHRAAELGRDLAAAGDQHRSAADEVLDCLGACGFEPTEHEGGIRLRNCPFDPLARDHPELICRMNQALLTGLVEGLAAGFEPSPDHDPTTCCVALRPQGPTPSPG